MGVDEGCEFGEVDDVVEDAFDLGFGEPEDGAVEVDVFSAGEFAVEPGAEFEEGGESASDGDAAGGGSEGAGDAFEEGGFPGSVVSEDGHGLAFGDGERHVVERFEFFVGVPAEFDHSFFGGVRFLFVDLEDLGDGVDLDRGDRHSDLLSEVVLEPAEQS